MIEQMLRTIALTAAERRPLPPALRDLHHPLALAVADRLERGETLPAALTGTIDPAMADLLAGPRPDTAEAALLAADWLRLRREARLAAANRLAHPVCALAVVAVAIALVAGLGPAPHAGWLAGAGVLLSGAVLTALASSGRLVPHLPMLASQALHARLASHYERAALVARWRLPEERLAPLLGDDLTTLAPVLAETGAEGHCRRLAEYHRAAERRAQARLWWTVMVLGYLAGGCLLLASAMPLASQWVDLLSGATITGLE